MRKRLKLSDRWKWRSAKGGSGSGGSGGGGSGSGSGGSGGGSTSADSKDKEITAEANAALERGGAIVIYKNGDLASNRQRRVVEKVQIGNRVYRKRADQTPLEATKSARVKVFTRIEQITDERLRLQRENSKLKGPENANKRKQNSARIRKLEAQAKKYDRIGNRLVSRERELKNKGIGFAFSGAKSKRNVLGVQLNREYSANRVLGLKPGASLHDANQAYKRLARRYHPDSNPGSTPREAQRNARKFQLATEAHQAYREFAPRALGVK